MNLREKVQQIEIKNLSKYAAKSEFSRGREVPEEQCDIRTDFQRDRDRILHSKAFRRLKDKMQVFIAPDADHIHTRLMHTLEVAQIARTIARALNLNEDLTEAVALGHDLGHAPFGHSGEAALNNSYAGGFAHNEQSLRVVDKLERDGAGLNLTFEIRDGIVNHRTGMSPHTLEGMIVQLSDKIAYLNHDIDDSISYGVIVPHDIPRECLLTLGDTSQKRINAMIRAVITESYNNDYIDMEKNTKLAVKQLRDFMFERVYMSDSRKKETEKISHVIKELYNHYLTVDSAFISDFAKMHNRLNDDPGRIVCDYISGMTDRYALSKYNEIFLPQYRSI